MVAQQSPSYMTCSLIQFQSTLNVNSTKHSTQPKRCKFVTSAFSRHHQLEQAPWVCELLLQHSCTLQCHPDTILVWYSELLNFVVLAGMGFSNDANPPITSKSINCCLESKWRPLPWRSSFPCAFSIIWLVLGNSHGSTFSRSSEQCAGWSQACICPWLFQ